MKIYAERIELENHMTPEEYEITQRNYKRGKEIQNQLNDLYDVNENDKQFLKARKEIQKLVAELNENSKKDNEIFDEVKKRIANKI